MTTTVTFVGRPFEVLRFLYGKTRGIWPTAVAVADDGYIYSDPLSSFAGITAYKLYPFDLSDPEGLDMRPHATIRVSGDKVLMDAVGLQAIDLVKRLSTLPVWSHRTEEVTPKPEEPMLDLVAFDPCTFSSPTHEVLRLTDTSFIYLGVAVDDGGAAKRAFLATLAPRFMVPVPPPSDSHDAFLGDGVVVESKPQAEITKVSILRCTSKMDEELLRITNDGIVVNGALIENPIVAQATFVAVMAKLVADG